MPKVLAEQGDWLHVSLRQRRRTRGWLGRPTADAPGIRSPSRAHWRELSSTLQGDEGARAFLAGRADVIAVERGDLATGEDVDVR